MYKLLLVDDEYMIINGMKKIINWQELGIEIVGTAKNGQEALSFMRQNEVDIVITDVMMPLMSGIEFIKAAQAEQFDFHFIMLSGFEEFKYMQAGIELGAENYLVKPINKEKLLKNVLRILSKSQLSSELPQLRESHFQEKMQRWFNGIITEAELEDDLFGGSFNDNALFTVIYFNGLTSTEQTQVITNCRLLNQSYYMSEGPHIRIVYEGNYQQALAFIMQFERLYRETTCTVGLGCVVTDAKDIVKSCQQALDMNHLARFYRLSLPEQLMQLNVVESKQRTSDFEMTCVSNALNQKADGTLCEVVAMFVRTMKQQLRPASYVHHLALLIVAEIHRHYDTNYNYENELANIAQTDTIMALETVLYTRIEQASTVENTILYSPNVQQVLALIEKNYQTDLTLKDVAQQLHLNAMYLGQLFKKETNQRFAQQLNAFRIEKAKELLNESLLNMNEISEAVGYMSAGYFYKMFKRIEGISPSEFRNETHQSVSKEKNISN
ncbi:response regulator transcription factor [Brochothrix campestris]|uniref:Two-component system response regulator n=1 Tax=Brochothrix campestris FSL F6-1037 TaxID=1265861 RepID=W7CZ89_9LIST|nr:response regulator transcription factor [Brochothrix campestris]EUJ42085.1 two-component system response regulator [Brochothrix campestris FSL F6-1037]